MLKVFMKEGEVADMARRDRPGDCRSVCGCGCGCGCVCGCGGFCIWVSGVSRLFGDGCPYIECERNWGKCGGGVGRGGDWFEEDGVWARSTDCCCCCSCCCCS